MTFSYVGFCAFYFGQRVDHRQPRPGRHVPQQLPGGEVGIGALLGRRHTDTRL